MVFCYAKCEFNGEHSTILGMLREILWFINAHTKHIVLKSKINYISNVTIYHGIFVRCGNFIFYRLWKMKLTTVQKIHQLSGGQNDPRDQYWGAERYVFSSFCFLNFIINRSEIIRSWTLRGKKNLKNVP